ncbi:MAG: DUF1926 domain-containing protein [Elusimicrobia bacterium]|nr:DUF1926 domain-containing protein [Elusimicrobiota bacterium]
MVTLLLGIHNHQPVGNFGDVLEKAYRLSYRPFLDVLERHPAIALSLHCSGILYEWLEAAHPDYLDRLAALARQGRLELLGGGFYEPIIAALPEKDQQGQIARMRGYLKRRFQVDAKGFWLAERVWEPQLPKILAKAGAEYTIVDDTHFLAVGFAEAELQGHFLTESEGQAIRVFPISQRLRYLMPYADPRQVIDHLRAAGEAAKGRDVALVMADDGEKFGLWPRTHELVYERGWLDRFFTLCAENAAWLKTATFSRQLTERPPLGWAYLPTTSYSELSEWALRADPSRELSRVLHQSTADTRRFIRGGYFRNFLTKYPEANRLYRKMLRVSGRVHALEPRGRRKASPQLDAALGYLWKGQCNCAYWHGVFGGLYLPHLRHAIYENLLRAEVEVERSRPASAGPLAPFAVEQEDWDGDGVPEVLVESPKANWYLTRKGGGLWEWDVKARAVNLGGVVSRRLEAYHEKLRAAAAGEGSAAASIHDAARAKQPGLDKELFYDWHGRMSLLDHFLHPDTRRETFASTQYGEQGDFVLEEYRLTPPKRDDGDLVLAFEREGTVWAHSRAVPVLVRKDVRLLAGGGWRCDYAVENRGQDAAELWFGAEVALALSTPAVCPPGEETGVALKTLRDDNLGLSVRLRMDGPLDLWSFPLYTISQSEEGFERTYQGSVLLLHRRLSLAAGSAARFTVAAEAEIFSAEQPAQKSSRAALGSSSPTG